MILLFFCSGEQSMLRRSFNEKFKKYKLTLQEKVAAGLMFLSAGIGVGAAFGVDIWNLITSTVNTGGIGVSVSSIGAVAGIVGASVVSTVIAVFVAYQTYKEYIETAKELERKIENKKAAQIRLKNELDVEALTYFAALLRFRILAEHQEGFSAESFSENINAKNPLNMSNNEFLSDIVASIYQVLQKEEHKELLLNLQKGSLNPEQLQQLAALQLPNKGIKLGEKLAQFFAITPPSIEPTPVKELIKMSLSHFFDGFSAIFGSGWGLLSVAAGTIAAVPAMLSTPIVGWLLLASAILLSVGLCCVQGYCRYKNNQRDKVQTDLKATNDVIKEKKKEISEALNLVNRDIEGLQAQTVDEKENKIAKLKKEIAELKSEVEQWKKKVEENKKTHKSQPTFLFRTSQSHEAPSAPPPPPNPQP